MSSFERQLWGMLAAGVLCFGQGPQSSVSSGVPPSLEESVPPAFDQYPLTPDSQPRPNVPAGATFTFEMTDSKIFPGTTRTITVYIPAAYNADKPACVYVGLDGLGFNAGTVFDNLIAQRAMPVTIGIGVSSGTVGSVKPPENPRFDRSFEFDSRNNRLVSFLLEEVFPEVEKHATPNGKPIHLSTNRNDRAIGGASTGGIGAFTAAWERPDAFSRVFSSIGTYVGMRGGESYYVLVRKTEPKPIRVFMEDGIHDEWPGGPEMGDWWMSNLTMERALEFAGYDVRHIWGAGTHNGTHATALFPEAMRWLWRDWPAPVKSGAPGNPVLQSILQPGEDWDTLQGQAGTKHVTANASGELQLSTDNVLATGPQNVTYRVSGSGNIIAAESGQLPSKNITLPGGRVQGLVVRSNGDVYATIVTDTGVGELWLVRSSGEQVRLDTGLKAPSGVALSPDGLWLMVAQSTSRQGISYRVRADSGVDMQAPFYDFYVPAWADGSGAGDIAMDRDGRAYVATLAGVQVFDRNGRVAAILPLPTNGPVTSVCFGGPDFHTLYAVSNGRVFHRRLRSTGAPPWAEPIVLPAWNAG